MLEPLCAFIGAQLLSAAVTSRLRNITHVLGIASVIAALPHNIIHLAPVFSLSQSTICSCRSELLRSHAARHEFNTTTLETVRVAVPKAHR